MFFKKPSPILLHSLLEKINYQESLSDIKNIEVHDVCALENIADNTIACYNNSKYKDVLLNTTKGIVILKKDDNVNISQDVIKIFDTKPYRLFAKIIDFLYPKQISSGIICESAKISNSAKIGKNVQIDSFCIIEDGAVIGDNCIIKSHSFIGKSVVIGNDCTIESHVVITNTIAKDRLFVKSGAKIGQSGFGFHMDESGHFDVRQLGKVLIGNDVQIGSNTCIDRGSQNDTIIEDFCKIDNLVQIAHNVKLGKGCVIVAQVGIAGSTKLGSFAIAAGQVGIAGHLNIGNGVKIAAQSGLMKDVKDFETVAGSPAVSVMDWHKQTIALKNLIKKKK